MLEKRKHSCLCNENTGIILGGVIVETNEKTQHNHLDFPVCKRNHSKQRHRTEDMEWNRNFISEYKNMGNLHSLLR